MVILCAARISSRRKLHGDVQRTQPVHMPQVVSQVHLVEVTGHNETGLVGSILGLGSQQRDGGLGKVDLLLSHAEMGKTLCDQVLVTVEVSSGDLVSIYTVFDWNGLAGVDVLLLDSLLGENLLDVCRKKRSSFLSETKPRLVKNHVVDVHLGVLAAGDLVVGQTGEGGERASTKHTQRVHGGRSVEVGW